MYADTHETVGFIAVIREPLTHRLFRYNIMISTVAVNIVAVVVWRFCCGCCC